MITETFSQTIIPVDDARLATGAVSRGTRSIVTFFDGGKGKGGDKWWASNYYQLPSEGSSGVSNERMRGFLEITGLGGGSNVLKQVTELRIERSFCFVREKVIFCREVVDSEGAPGSRMTV